MSRDVQCAPLSVHPSPLFCVNGIPFHTTSRGRNVFFSTRANTDGMAFQHYVLHLESVFSSTIPQSHGRNNYQALVGAVRKFAQQYFTQAQCLSSTSRTIPHGQNVYPALFPRRCPSIYCLTGISCSTQGPPAHVDRLFHHHRGGYRRRAAGHGASAGRER